MIRSTNRTSPLTNIEQFLASHSQQIGLDGNHLSTLIISRHTSHFCDNDYDNVYKLQQLLSILTFTLKSIFFTYNFYGAHHCPTLFFLHQSKILLLRLI